MEFWGLLQDLFLEVIYTNKSNSSARGILFMNGSQLTNVISAFSDLDMSKALLALIDSEVNHS